MHRSQRLSSAGIGVVATRLRASALVIATTILAVSTATVAQSQERVLPIRGRELLEQLVMPLRVPNLVSVSPDGSKVVYEEVTFSFGPRRVSNIPNQMLPDTTIETSRLFVMDIVTGRRRALPDHVMSVAASDYFDRLNLAELDRSPEWAQDSRRVALLTADSSGAVLSIWRTTESAPPIRIPVRHLDGATLRSYRIANWAWISERDELIVALAERTKPPSLFRRIRSATEGRPRQFARFRSRLVAQFDELARESVATVPLKLLAINISTQEVSELPTGVPLYAVEHDRFNPAANGWRVSPDRRRLLFMARTEARSHAHVVGNDRSESYSLLLLGRNDPRLVDPRNHLIRNRLFAMDLSSRAIKEVSTGSAGQLAAFTPSHDGSNIVTAVRDTSHTAWPNNGAFAQLRHFTAAETGNGEVFGQPVVLPVALFATGSRNAVYVYEAKYPEHRILELEATTGRQTQLSPRGVSVSAADVSADGRTIVAVLENVNTVPDVHVWDSQTRVWRRLTTYADDHSGPAVGAVDHITWRSKDDRFDIDGFLVKPRSFDSKKKYPLLVFLHGGQGSGQINRFSPRPFGLYIGVGGLSAHVFAEAGYLVLLPNFRGDRGYSAEFSRALLGHAGQEVTYDINAGIDYLIASGIVDSAHVGIVGHSWGGNQVAYAISHHSDRYAAAVINDSRLLIPEIFVPAMTVAHDMPADNFSQEAWHSYFGFDPLVRNERWVDVNRIRTPLLLRWATVRYPTNLLPELDSRHPIWVTTEILYTALRRNGVPIEVIDDHGWHWLSLTKYAVEYHSRLLQWFDYFLLGKGENPIPAMMSPFDYSEELDRLDSD